MREKKESRFTQKALVIAEKVGSEVHLKSVRVYGVYRLGIAGGGKLCGGASSGKCSSGRYNDLFQND